MREMDARVVALAQLMVIALDQKTPAGPRVMALRTIMEATGVIGAKGTPVTATEVKRAEQMTPGEMEAELERLRSDTNIH
jgi:hypothetical protein